MGFQPDLREGGAVAGFVLTPGLCAPAEAAGFTRRDPMTRRLQGPVSPAEAPKEEHAPDLAPADPAPLAIQPPALAPRPIPVTYSAEQMAAARSEAHREGAAQGRAEAEAEVAAERQDLARAAQALAAAMAALTHPAPARLQELTDALNRAVLTLAAARAGQAIDSMPDPFARRVAALIERLGQGLQEVVVHLHPDDLAVVAPLLSGPVAPELALLAACRLLPDPALARGDAELHAPGLRLIDLLRDLPDAGTFAEEAP